MSPAGGLPGGGSVRLAAADVRLGGRGILRGVDLAIAPGEMVALVGPSGAGKTTLLRLMGAVLRADAGRVEVGGRDLATLGRADLRALRAATGFIPQDLRLVPNLRVVQNVMSGGLGRRGLAATLRLLLRPRPEDLAEAHRLLERVGIPEKMFERTDRLSGGQARRVAVARALFQRPGLLLADEPTASVDPARARATLELLTGIAREEGLTLCVSLHDPLQVREFFPRAVGLRAGQVVLDGDPAAFGAADLAALYALEESGEA